MMVSPSTHNADAFENLLRAARGTAQGRPRAGGASDTP
jgi:hypothetical protein